MKTIRVAETLGLENCAHDPIEFEKAFVKQRLLASDITSKRILVTGAKGFLATYVTERLMREKRKDEEYILLARGDKEVIKKQIESNFFAAAEGFDNGYNYRVVTGDITEENLGITESIPKIDLILHCAGVLSFKPGDAKLDYAVNVEGTKNVIAFAKKHKARIVFFSTAYRCGKDNGVIKENDYLNDKQRQYYNPYEETKDEAEKLVRAHDEESIIIRPGIVIGHSNTGTTLTYSGYYNVAGAFDYLKKKIISDFESGDQGRIAELLEQGIRINGDSYLMLPIRFPCKPEKPINLIPVNFLAEMSAGIIRSGIPGTYHVVNPNPITFWSLADFSFDILGIKGIEYYTEDSLPNDPSGIEKLLYRAIGVYFPYLGDNRCFSYENTKRVLYYNIPEMSITKEMLHGIIRYAQYHNYGKKEGHKTPKAY